MRRARQTRERKRKRQNSTCPIWGLTICHQASAASIPLGLRKSSSNRTHALKQRLAVAGRLLRLAP